MGAALLALFASLELPAQSSATAARLATAKLAETRGELAAAEAELRAALAGSNGADRAQVEAELQRLLQRQGRGAAAPVGNAVPAPVAQDPQGAAPRVDPVQRLIERLDEGAHQDPSINPAFAQLQSLGALATPPLLAALPKLGPFGLANVLELLIAESDERAIPVLLRLLDEPAAAIGIAQRLPRFGARVAVPVALAVAERDVPAAAKLGALRALLAHAAAVDVQRALALNLAKEPALQGTLLSAIDDTGAPWRAEVCAVLMQSPDAKLRANATMVWLRAAPGLTEDDALARLQELPPDTRWWVAADAASRQPAWVRVGLLSLAGRDVPRSTIQRVEWWRAPEPAAAALLAVRGNQEDTAAVLGAIAGMVARGWSVSAEPQPELERAVGAATQFQGRWQLLVRALPADAEDRALAAWQRLEGEWHRVEFTKAAVAGGRPWHRLVAAQLRSVGAGAAVPRELIARDWTGAPADAIAALVALVERFPADATGGDFAWHDDLIATYRRCADLPAATVLPLTALGHLPAFAALVERHPGEALALLRAGPSSLDASAVAWAVVARHGGPDDVGTAVRLVRRGMPPDGSHFFDRHGRGRTEVVALARNLPREGAPSGLLQVAQRAAAHLTRDSLPAVLAMLPELAPEVFAGLTAALEARVQPEDAPALAAAIDAAVADGDVLRRTRVLHTLVRWAAATESVDCLPALRRALALPIVSPELTRATAEAALRVAAGERRALLQEMLRSTSPVVVVVAAAVPEVRTDAALRSQVFDAVLRLGHQLDADAQLFAAFEPADANALAIAILAHERLPQFSRSLCAAAMQTLRRARQAPDLVRLLARGAQHPDEHVRLDAALQLGATFDRDAAPVLLDLLKDEVEGVRVQAQTSLDQIANYLDARAKWEQRLK